MPAHGPLDGLDKVWANVPVLWLANTVPYQSAILSAIRPITTRTTESDKEATHAWMFSVLTGQPARMPVPPPRLRRDELLLVELFRGLTEISATVEYLKQYRDWRGTHRLGAPVSTLPTICE